MKNLPRLPRIFIWNWAVACCSGTDSILRLTRVSVAGYELRLILSCGWLEFQWLDESYGWLQFRRLDTSGGWFYPTTDSSSSGWILVATNSSSAGWIHVAADSILWLTLVPAVGYESLLILPCSWLEFRQLDMSCDWFYHPADSSSSGWTGVVTDSVTWLTRVSVAEHELRLIPSYGCFEFQRLDTSCSWFYPAADSRSASWIQLAANLYFYYHLLLFIYLKLTLLL